MTFWLLIRRSLRFHARSHLGVVLGAVIGSAALTGALIVGDSVRGSLRERALNRLRGVQYAMNSGDRFFLQDLGTRLGEDKSGGVIRVGNLSYPAIDFQKRTAALMLVGTIAREDGRARANAVSVLGIDPATWNGLAYWPGESRTSGKTVGSEQLARHSSTLNSDSLERWKAGEVLYVNEELARRLDLHENDGVILRIRKPTALAQDAVLSPRDETSLALRLKVGTILSGTLLADFSLASNPAAQPNAFLPLEFLAGKVELAGRANLLLNGSLGTAPQLKDPAVTPEALRWLAGRLENNWSLEDAQLSVKKIEPPETATGGEQVPPSVEVSSSRIFLEPAVVAAALKPRTGLLTHHAGFTNDSADDLASCGFVTNGTPLLTYLANLIRAGERSTPYSMITAAGGRFVPADMRDDEILVNEWLADDLQAKPGDSIQVSYYAVDSASRLIERTNSFRVRAIAPLKGLYADRTLMPEFPGIAKAERTQDWDTGFPLTYKIRDKDEAYWRRYRGTPKAFVTLAAGQAMWSSRFGNITAIRYEVPASSSPRACRELAYRNLLANLNPAQLGFHFEPVREQALKAASQSQDFGQLFLGFSIFLVAAALLLMALLFQFSLEQRRAEVGTLLALGWKPAQVRHLLLAEGVVLALIGGFIGAAGGIGYAKAMLWALTTIWRRAVGTSVLHFYASGTTLLIGFITGVVVAILTIWLTLRQQARQPTRELLSAEAISAKPGTGRVAKWVASLSCLAGLALIVGAVAHGDTANAEVFFGAGSLLLLAGLALASIWLTQLERRTRSAPASLGGLGARACARRRKRSLATIALLSCGCFVIVSIGVFRLDASRDANRRSSGTGGFALIGQATLPVVQDLNSEPGRQFFGLSGKDFEGVSVVPFRVHDGDEASCLNLNRAQKPRLLGIKPGLLAGRFTFVAAAKGLDIHQGWNLLGPAQQGAPAISSDEIPAVGDANSIEWALGKSVGDMLDYTDEQGRIFKLRLVGAVANSILQGSLIIDEAQFMKRFPGESGYRFFLMDAPRAKAASLSATLSRALQDVGLEITPAVERLDAFNAVQNTYLGTFQILGGLGLLLGSGGLGVVVLRNVLERRGELGLLLAVGFRKRALHWLVLAEHGALLLLGLGLGVAAAAVAVLPALLSPARQLPYGSLSVTLAAVLLNGAAWTWVATRVALRGNLLAALRNE